MNLFKVQNNSFSVLTDYQGGFAKCYEFTTLEPPKVQYAAKLITKSSLTKSRARTKVILNHFSFFLRSRFTDHFSTNTLLALSISLKIMIMFTFCLSYVQIKLSMKFWEGENDCMNLKYNVMLCKSLVHLSICMLTKLFIEIWN